MVSECHCYVLYVCAERVQLLLTLEDDLADVPRSRISVF